MNSNMRKTSAAVKKGAILRIFPEIKIEMYQKNSVIRWRVWSFEHVR
jgi:hypothetical protein